MKMQEVNSATVIELRHFAHSNGVKNVKKYKKAELTDVVKNIIKSEEKPAEKPAEKVEVVTPEIITESSPSDFKNTRGTIKFQGTVPKATKSYQPVRHSEVVEFVKEHLDKRGLVVENENVTFNKTGSQMFGQVSVGANNTDMRMSIGFRNSYDKSMPVGFVSGSQVIVCSNMMFEGDIVQMRRHTTNIMTDLDKVFEPVLGQLDDKFQEMVAKTELMKNAELQLEEAQKMFGELLMRSEDYNNLIATKTELNEAVRLFQNPIHDFGNDSKWGFYNAFTEVLKGAHPYYGAKQHINLHNFVLDSIN